MATRSTYWQDIIAKYREDPELATWLTAEEARDLEKVSEQTLAIRKEALYQGFDILRILKLARARYLDYMSNVVQEEVSIQVRVSGEEKEFKYRNNLAMHVDLQFLFFVFAARGCSYDKIIEKSNPVTAKVLEWIVAKFGIDTTVRPTGHSLGPNVVTIPRLTACFPTIFCGIFHERKAKEIITMEQIGIDPTLSHALVCPMFVSCVPPSSIESGNNVHVIFFCVRVMLDNVLHRKTEDYTGLLELLAYYKAAYGSVATPDTSRVKYMRHLGLLNPGQATFINGVKLGIPFCEGVIRDTRPTDSDLDAVLREVKALKSWP